MSVGHADAARRQAGGTVGAHADGPSWHAFAVPLPRASPCDGCDARCCRGAYSIHLTLDDVARISSGLDLAPARFAASQPQVTPSATGFLLERGGRTHDLALGFRLPPDPEPGCMFLQDGRCSAYGVRPRACRRFPAAAEGGRVVAREGIVCGTARWAAAMGQRSWRAELEREQREVALHAVVVADWNARVERGGERPLPLERFLEHLEDAWSVVARLRETVRPSERAGGALLGRVREILAELP